MFEDKNLIENIVISRLYERIGQKIGEFSHKRISLNKGVLSITNLDSSYCYNIVYENEEYMIVIKERKTSKVIIVQFAKLENTVIDLIEQNIL